MSDLFITWLRSHPEVIATILGGVVTILGLFLVYARKKLEAAIKALDATTAAIEATTAPKSMVREAVSRTELTARASAALETSIGKVAPNRVRI